MNLLPAIVGAVAVAGLVIAWRFRALAPLFLAAGAGLSFLTFILLVLRNPGAAALLVMLSVPYWLAWFFVYLVFGVSPTTEHRER